MSAMATWPADRSALDLPPLWRPTLTLAPQTPFAAAIAAAKTGADGVGEPGSLFHNAPGIAEPDLEAAAILAPQMPLDQAMVVIFAASLALADAIGALGPPEVAVHLAWPGRILVNGADCGRVRAAAPPTSMAEAPEFLVLGLHMAIAVQREEGGHATGATTLHQEGCGEVTAAALLETWSRHALVWINRLVDDGPTPILAAWQARWCERDAPFRLSDALPGGVDDGVAAEEGIARSVDEVGAVHLTTAAGDMVVPLTRAVEPA